MHAVSTEAASEAMSRIDACLGLEGISDALLEVVEPLGIDKVVAGVIRTRKSAITRKRSHVLWNNYPKEWVARYCEHHYEQKDPVLRRVQRHEFTGIAWERQDTYQDNDDKDGIRVMDEARDFRLNSGYSIADSVGGDVLCMSYVGRYRLDLGPDQTAFLDSVGLHALKAAHGFVVARETVDLTHRMVRTLQLAADGLSDDEIASEFGITKSGAVELMRTARVKLDANDRTHAVVIALRKGIIR